MRRGTINLLLFLVPIFLLGSVNLLNPAKATVSEIENRTLKTRPAFSTESLFKGQFCREYEDYFADTFTFRDKFAQLSAGIKEYKGLNDESGATIVMNHGANAFEAQRAEPPANSPAQVSPPKNPDSAKGPTDNQLAVATKKDENDGRVVGRILILGDRAMETHIYNAAASQYYAATINKFQAAVGNGVKVYSLLAPTQIEFLNNPKFKDVSAPQKRTIEYVDKYLSPSVIPVDAYDALRRNADKYVYFRTDHHWTALGAYYAYTAFMKARDEAPVPLSKYQQGTITGFLGTTYNMTLSKKLASNPDTIYYYKPFIQNTYYVYYSGAAKMPVIDLSNANTKQKYRVFISGDRPLGKIVTKVNNGKKVLVIKDSYGNALVPFLIPHYQEIYIVDPRQYKNNILKLVKDNGIQEVVFLNYILVTGNNDWSNLIIDMMKR